jgi:Trk K+ transport system NAD-binding subunit
LPVAEVLRAALLIPFSNGHLADAFEDYASLSLSLRWLELLLSVAATVLTAVLCALLTDRLLSAHFQLLARRPRPPLRGHVVIAGLGSAGRETAGFLMKLHRTAVAIDKAPIEPHVLPDLPVVHADALQIEGLQRARVAAASGVVAATGDDLLNVEIALLARSLNPNCELVVRLLDARFIDSVAALLPHAQVLCTESLAAAAFGAAALGEQVSSVFYLENTPILVTEYLVEAGDGLVGRSLWEIAEGYGVMPLFVGRSGSSDQFALAEVWPTRVCAGEHLVILASAMSLEAIARADMMPRDHVLHLEQRLPFAEEVQVVGVLSRTLGYTLSEAHALVRSIPITLPERVYRIHGQRSRRPLEGDGLVVSLRRV